MRQLMAFEEWAEQLMVSIRAVAREGGGRILLRRGGENCDEGFQGSCPCGPQILTVNKDGNVQ
jgi:hypothetical protein